MTRPLEYVAAPPGEVYWREEVCPHRGSTVLLRTVHGVLIKGVWQGELGQYFDAWSPMPKRGAPQPDVNLAPLRERLRFAFKLIFNPRRSR